MKRDRCRDYATQAFVWFGAVRNKSVEEFIVEEGIDAVEYEDFCADLFAVAETLFELAATDREYIIDAVREVYMCSRKFPGHDDIACRVRHHAFAVPATEKTVYKWLETARDIFADKRGLTVKVPPGFEQI